LSTPDVQDVQTPVLQKLLIQNQLEATETTTATTTTTTSTTTTVKQETNQDSNPPSVNSATSSNMSQEQDQATVVTQSENDNENGQAPIAVIPAQQGDKVLEVANVLLKASGGLQAVSIPSK